MPDDFPFGHGLFIYGQARADGWACRDCEWQTYNIQWDREVAQAAHDAESPRCLTVRHG